MNLKRFPTVQVCWLALVMLLVALLPGMVKGQSEATPTKTVEDIPTTLLGSVTSFYLREPKLFSHLAPPPCGPNAAQTPQVTTYETISRIPTRGGPLRYLYLEAQACNTDRIQSNIVADDSYVYWTGPNGLMRLSTNANPGDAPELVNGLLAGRTELAIDDTHVFVMIYDSNNYATLYRVPKTGGAAIYMTGSGVNAARLQTSYSFHFGTQTQRYYVYWIQGGNLWRFNVDTLATDLLAAGVTGYHAEGGRTTCGGGTCFFSDIVFIARGNQVVTYNNITGNSGAPVYCSNNPCNPDPNHVVFSLTADGDNLYFFEERRTGCAPLCTYTDFLLRTPRGGGAVDTLYFTNGISRAARLTTNETHLFWQDDALKRLPNNAAALPSINLFAAGLKVTQGVQDNTYSVPLIQYRRTFVRFFVSTPLPGNRPVLALLYGSWDGGSGGPLLPANPAGTEIRIKVFQDYNNINDSFLFELPWEWTSKSNLMLTAVVNPYQFPLEPNYNDNTSIAGPFNFLPSPTLKVTLASLGYRLNNQTFYPDYQRDVLGAASLVRRMFPLANTAGGTGFVWDYWQLLDEGLGSRVNMTNAECNDYISWENGTMVDRRNLCSSRYANHLLAYLRSAWRYSANLFVYGMISSAGPGADVRGQAFPWARVSSGAAENAQTAVHEIAHTLSRDHPFKGSSLDTNVCGNTPQDGPMDHNYPYANSRIGIGLLEGFDSGDGLLGIPPSIKPNDQWFDIIGYCGPRWISDYTYKGVYNYMIANPPQAKAQSSAAQVPGEWLYIAGNIRADGSSASLLFVRRMSNPASVPPLGTGAYAIQLYDSNGVLLADHPFSGQSHGEDDYLNIEQAVPYVNGTRQVRIVRQANAQTLAIWSLSANPPTISNANLAASSPVTGTVILNWTAGDPDGDALTFDILYQRVGETEFRPVRLGVSGNSTQIDTAQFSGGGAVLRVVASDGGHIAQADTPPFTVSSKPPRVAVLNPANGLRIHYGQLINFSGEAFDLQDGWLDGAALVWRNQRGQVLGTGPFLSVTDLLVGVNTITLTATNSLGLTASASVVVIVDDDLRLPGPYLSVGPDQVNWHLAPGTTALQAAEVSVSNAGSGSLTWTASSDQPWLSLSAASGSAPITLTLTANPVTFSAGNIYTATVTLTGNPGVGQPLQTVVLPVQVAVGNVVSNAITMPARQIFLPFIRW